MKSTKYKITHTCICIHTHRHMFACLRCYRPWPEGSVWAMARREGGGGDMSDRQNIHTLTQARTWAASDQRQRETGSEPIRTKTNGWPTKNYPTLAKGQCIHTKNIFKKKKNKEKGNRLNNFMLLLIFKLIMRWEGTEGERSRKEGALRTSPNINSNRRTEPQVFKFAALSATCLDTNTVIKPAYIHAHTHTNTHTRLTYTYANIYMHVNTDVHAHRHTHTQR